MSKKESRMLSTNLSENINTAREIFTIGKSFDYIERELYLGATPAYLLSLNGFTQTTVLQRIISDLQNESYTRDLQIKDYRTYVNAKIGYAQVEFVSDWERIVKMVLSGTCLILFEGSAEGILLDTRTYPTRGTQEPDTEKVTRGAKDGFVENFLVNTTLIRRRIRSPKLTFRINEVGTDSKSDVVIAY
ncbi:MAG: spore germination protein, partial [Lachnospiraceae bacterium]|nr:spore germination protein [Lachnospiraceae bacterium]